MAITFFNVATVPADNSAQAGPTVTLTPPASMVDGDLVYVSVRYRDSAATIADAPSNTGGQTWNTTTQYNTTNIRARVFWCRFNGTWSANPAFTVTSGTNNMDAQMLVFRPTSAAYTWSVEAGPTPANYSAPSTPFTVTVTGRNTTAASTATVAAWHSIDDNSYGTLAGTGWSKTNLGAQYRNNSSNDNSSSFAYNIRTTAGTVANVSQNQSALGGDAGSVSLITFAEILVSVALSGVSSTASVGTLAVSNVEAGIAGVQSVTALGDLAAIVPGGGTNATGSPPGVAATGAVGALSLVISSVAEPSGVGIGAAVGSLAVSGGVAASGVSATAEIGTPLGLGGSPNVVQIGGVSATAQVGSLSLSIAVVGLEGFSIPASVGTLAVTGAGILHGTGQPTTVFATAQVGGVAVSITRSIEGVFATAVAEELLSASITEEVDGTQSAAAFGSLTPHIGTPLDGVSATAALGSLTRVATASAPASGVQAIATLGTLVGTTDSSASAVAQGVEATAEVGDLQPSWTGLLDILGVEAVAEVGIAGVEGGDSTDVEAFPAGVQAIAQIGVLSTGEALAALQGLTVTAQVGSPTVLIGGPQSIVGRRATAVSVARISATASVSSIKGGGSG